MKKLFLLFTLFIFFGCSNDDSNSDENQQEEFGTKEIIVTIELPENSNINPDDLTVSTIFTDNGEINDGNGTVEIFDNNAIELIYATNSSDKIVLMSYLNPSSTNTIELNSTTTAQTLAMLHPWSMHLSVQAREEALQEIISLSEYESYHNQIIASINSGETDPLASQDILNALGEFQTALFNRVEQEIPPLKMVAENDLATLTNTKSSFAYDVQLFNENGDAIGESVTLDGQNKSVGVFSTLFGFISGNNLFQDTNTSLPIPNTNQEYQVVAKTWSGNASWINGANLLGDSFSILSTTLGTIIKSSQCALELGNFIIDNNTNLLNLISNDEITAGQATSSLLQFIQQNSNTILQIIVNCRGGFGGSNLSQFTTAFSIIGNINGFISSAFRFTDLVLYDSEIEFCFERTGNEITECENEIVGTWQMIFDCSGGQYPPLGPLNVTFFDDSTMNIENVGSINGCTDNGSYSFDGTNLSFIYTSQCDETSQFGEKNDSWDFTGTINSENNIIGNLAVSFQTGSFPPDEANCTATLSN